MQYHHLQSATTFRHFWEQDSLSHTGNRLSSVFLTSIFSGSFASKVLCAGTVTGSPCTTAQLWGRSYLVIMVYLFLMALVPGMAALQSHHSDSQLVH